MKLRMKPYLNVIQNGPESCCIMASEKELFRCSGKTVPLLVNDALPLMDGSRSVEEIGMALSSTLNQESVEALVSLLLRNRIVEDVSEQVAFSQEELEAAEGILTLFSRYSSHPFQLLGQMKTAHVAVVGDTAWVDEVVEALVDCAVGTITVVEGKEIRKLQEVVAKADVVIGIQDGEFSMVQPLQELNRACMQTDTPWLLLRQTLEAEGWVGPFFQSEGPCVECMSRRLDSHLNTWRDNQLYRQKVKQGEIVGKQLLFRPFRKQLAMIAAFEVVKYMTNIEPTNLVGRTRLIDFLTQESSLHTVLKVPHCPSCSRGRNTRVYPWDEDQIRIERMLL